ncbi:carboxymuconolactone decarboxylase family protein [Solimonas soli]|uniref:carboxymuconolactone decarboxylase family protein n=1 Tax=Solimonas soli TaxID=413479 RepID=UPI00047FD78C|nr:carboxymuconolactone decarboxylase family protein [Solimonas soli]
MSAPRIAPLEAPYTPAVQAAFDRVMRGAPPLLLFRCVGRNPRVLERMMAGGLLDRGSIPLRLRELVILRTTARCGAEYEWGVHVAAYGEASGWTAAERAATLEVPVRSPAWTREERLAIALVDALHDANDIDDALWAALAACYADEQLIELIMLSGLYHAVSFLCLGLRLPLEHGAPRFTM